MDKLTHLNEQGHAHMVDVGDKTPTTRRAVAEAFVKMKAETLALLRDGKAPKGDVMATARLAGIQAAKQTSNLIPLCHLLALSSVKVSFKEIDDSTIRVEAAVRCDGKTGVEMEALTAASVASLTLYDMLKAVDKAIVIDGIALVSKEGGKSGDYRKATPNS